MAETNGAPFDPGTARILRELRDLGRQAAADRREAAADRREAIADRRRSDERFEQTLREIRGLREDSLRRDAMFGAVFRDIHTVGRAIVKALIQQKRTLDNHSRLLESIDRRLGGRGNSWPGTNGPRA